MGAQVRLQKILAEAGFGSRRACEAFILDGRVTVDGMIVRKLGSKADPETQTIALDGQTIGGRGKKSRAIKQQGEKVYYILNKPKGVVCTNEDPSGRPLAVQLVPERRRIFCVGRLDLETEGLLLLTNDGEMTNLLTHPRYSIEKVYIAKVEGEVSGIQLEKLQNGVRLAEGKTQGAAVHIKKKNRQATLLEIGIHEGLNRQVRRMLAAVDLQVRHLRRVRIGPIRLSDLPLGASRRLSAPEIELLKKAVERAKRTAEAGQPTQPLRTISRSERRALREDAYQARKQKQEERRQQAAAERSYGKPRTAKGKFTKTAGDKPNSRATRPAKSFGTDKSQARERRGSTAERIKRSDKAGGFGPSFASEKPKRSAKPRNVENKQRFGRKPKR